MPSPQSTKRRRRSGDETDPVVVGINHSDSAKAALRFALDEARLRQTTLRVVHAWQFGYVGTRDIEGVYPVFGANLSELHRAAQAALEATLAEAVPDTAEVEIERRVVEGTPATVLAEESRDAGLLVVGSRGHGGLAGVLLGSVSQQVAHHASCPVVIVHREPRRSLDGR